MTQDGPAWFTHSSLGAWDPEGCLVCVIDEPEEATRAVAALLNTGFTAEDVRLFLGEEGLAFEGAPHWQGIPKRVFFFLINLTDDAAFEREYREEARHGRTILMVHAPQEDQCNQARELLNDYHARAVKYYGPWVVRGLDWPSSRPTD